jgi:hypothetical protein
MSKTQKDKNDITLKADLDLLRNTLDDIDFEIILLIKLRMSKVEKI